MKLNDISLFDIPLHSENPTPLSNTCLIHEQRVRCKGSRRKLTSTRVCSLQPQPHLPPVNSDPTAHTASKLSPLGLLLGAKYPASLLPGQTLYVIKGHEHDSIVLRNICQWVCVFVSMYVTHILL